MDSLFLETFLPPPLYKKKNRTRREGVLYRRDCG